MSQGKGRDCPHCLTSSSKLLFKAYQFHVGENVQGTIGGSLIWNNCPKCGDIVVYFRKDTYQAPTFSIGGAEVIAEIQDIPDNAFLVFPRKKKPIELSNLIPSTYSDDYLEAYNVLDISPKASAALSRRCLQRLLREKGEVKPGSLANEISQIASKLPSELRQNVDAIRNFGNFASHPNKDVRTGEVIDVEPQEAEWTLEILKSLLEYFIVKPLEYAERRKLLNSKLENAGKTPMKQ